MSADEVDPIASRLGITRTLAETEGIGDVDGIAVEGETSEIGLARGTALGRYILLDRVGAGGMGVVYAAYDPELDRKVAIKVLHAGPGRDASEGRVRLLREAQAMARLSHPNIALVHDVGTFEQQVFVAMAFIEGDTMGAWLKASARPWPDVVAVLGPVARALAAIHGAGMVHRDVKPDNIMVGRDGRVYLMDLGLTRGRDPSQSTTASDVAPSTTGGISLPTRVTSAGVVTGTPAYMAPEQHMGGGPDALADQFSFGVTLFEALWGARPFAGETYAQIATAIMEGEMRRAVREADVPPWLRDIVMRTLANDATQRYASMDIVADELTRPRRSTGLRIVGGIAVLGLAVAATAYGVTTDERACDAVGDEIAEAWNDEQRESAKAAITAGGSPFAADAADRTIARLDRYAEDWRAVRREACEATRVGARQSTADGKLELACLEHRRQELAAFVAVIGQPSDRLAERSLQAALDLPDPGQCVDEGYLAARSHVFADAQLGRDVVALRAKLVEARALERAARYDDAATIVDEVIAAATELDERALRAEAYVRRGALDNLRGRFADAETNLVSAYTDGRWSRHDVAAIEAAVQMVYVLGVGAGRPEDARMWGRFAEAELGATAAHAEMRADLENNLGATAMHHTDYATALTHYERALELGTGVYGREHVRVARYRANMVPALAHSGQPDRALELGLETLAHYESVLGKTHPNVALLLNNIGTSMYNADRADQAIEYFQRAYELQKAALGPRHPDVGISASNIGAMLHLQARDDEARASCLEALDVLGAKLGEDHISLASIEHNLGTIEHVVGNVATSRKHHERALAIREKRLGADHALVADSCIELGRIAIDERRFDDAAALFDRAAKIGGVIGEARFAGRAHAGRGLMLLAQGEEKRARVELQLAHAGLGDVDGIGSRARLAYARVLAEGGEVGRAIEVARAAKRGFESSPKRHAGEMAAADRIIAGR